MEIKQIRHEDVSKDGKVKEGGLIHTEGKVIIGRGEGCSYHQYGCRCSEGFYISIIKPLKAGIVEGLMVIFDSEEEFDEFMKLGELTLLTEVKE